MWWLNDEMPERQGQPVAEVDVVALITRASREANRTCFRMRRRGMQSVTGEFCSCVYVCSRAIAHTCTPQPYAYPWAKAWCRWWCRRGRQEVLCSPALSSGNASLPSFLPVRSSFLAALFTVCLIRDGYTHSLRSLTMPGSLNSLSVLVCPHCASAGAD